MRLRLQLLTGKSALALETDQALPDLVPLRSSSKAHGSLKSPFDAVQNVPSHSGRQRNSRGVFVNSDDMDWFQIDGYERANDISSARLPTRGELAESLALHSELSASD
jgi:hypothetical protein